MTAQDELRAAAQAVVDHWDTPLWKGAPFTVDYINRLRAALTAFPPQQEQAMTTTQPGERAELLSKLSADSFVLEHLPELPGYNGGILMIDDVEAERIRADIDEAIAVLSAAPAQQPEAAKPCGCREGECESKAFYRCRIADEIAHRDASACMAAKVKP